MIKVQVQENTADRVMVRSMAEMNEMLTWVIETFPNEMDPGDRWSYGSDTPAKFGHTLLSGPWEIEYFEFRDSKDAEWFSLRWA